MKNFDLLDSWIITSKIYRNMLPPFQLLLEKDIAGFFFSYKEIIREVLELRAPVTVENRVGYSIENKDVKCWYAHSTGKPAELMASDSEKKGARIISFQTGF